MDQTTARARAASTVGFEDGFGKRHQVVGLTPEPLEVLVLKEELAKGPGFKDALRAQVGRLVGFRHRSFAQARGIGRPPKNEAGLAIIFERVPGVRLSELLVSAEKRRIPIDMATACWVTRELIAAVAAFHEALPGVCHGAIAPERIVVTPDGRVVLMEHVFGGALPTLQWSRAQYWRDLRVALPSGHAAPTFDSAIDVVQVGTVALALMLAHPLGDGYPQHVGRSAEGRSALSAEEALKLLPDGIRIWMSRALQFTVDDLFASAGDARADLERVLEATEYAATTAPEAFMEAYHSFDLEESAAQSRQTRREAAPVPVTTNAAIPPPAPAAESKQVVNEPRTPAQVPEDAVHAAPISALDKWAAEPAPSQPLWMRHRYMIAAAAVLVLVVSGTAFAIHGRRSGEASQKQGTLAIKTDPTGLDVNIDGQSRGLSPLRLGLAPGNHILEVKSETDSKRVTVAVAAGAEVTQFVELPKTATESTGQLQIRTEPSGARITVDGRKRGVSPMTVDELTPGPHTVTVENDLGRATERVNVRAGTTAPLALSLSAPPAAVPVTTPPAATASGAITVAAPANVQVFENKRLIGTSGDRIAAPAGRHDLEFVSDVLGFRETRSVIVNPSQVSTVTLNWPKGSLSLNALPWAEVWLDGERVGETPLGDVSVPIGTHDVVFRHPELGEQRFRAVVTLAGPARLSADLRKK